MKELRPCPVCGRGPTIAYNYNYGRGLWLISCVGKDKDHHLWVCKAGPRTWEQAIAAWNRRADGCAWA